MFMVTTLHHSPPRLDIMFYTMKVLKFLPRLSEKSVTSASTRFWKTIQRLSTFWMALMFPNPAWSLSRAAVWVSDDIPSRYCPIGLTDMYIIALALDVN